MMTWPLDADHLSGDVSGSHARELEDFFRTLRARAQVLNV